MATFTATDGIPVPPHAEVHRALAELARVRPSFTTDIMSILNINLEWPQHCLTTKSNDERCAHPIGKVDVLGACDLITELSSMPRGYIADAYQLEQPANVMLCSHDHRTKLVRVDGKMVMRVGQDGELRQRWRNRLAIWIIGERQASAAAAAAQEAARQRTATACITPNTFSTYRSIIPSPETDLPAADRFETYHIEALDRALLDMPPTPTEQPQQTRQSLSSPTSRPLERFSNKSRISSHSNKNSGVDSRPERGQLGVGSRFASNRVAKVVVIAGLVVLSFLAVSRCV